MKTPTPMLDDLSWLAGELAPLSSNEHIYFLHANADKYQHGWFVCREPLAWLIDWLKSQIESFDLSLSEDAGALTYPMALHAAYVVYRISEYSVNDIDPEIIKGLRGPLACLINAVQQASFDVLDFE